MTGRVPRRGIARCPGTGGSARTVQHCVTQPRPREHWTWPILAGAAALRRSCSAPRTGPCLVERVSTTPSRMAPGAGEHRGDGRGHGSDLRVPRWRCQAGLPAGRRRWWDAVPLLRSRRPGDRGVIVASHLVAWQSVLSVGEQTCGSRNARETPRGPSANGRDRHRCKRMGNKSPHREWGLNRCAPPHDRMRGSRS